MKTTEKSPLAEKATAEAKEVAAKAKLQQATAEVKKTKAELDAVSGVATVKDRVKQGFTGVKEFAAADLEQTKADFKRVHDRVAAWDDASARDFHARLDAADAQLAVWKAAGDVKRVEQNIKRHDDFATLEEKIALARARSAEAKQAKYSAKAQAALEEAARAFEDAYEAAAKRYSQRP